MSFEYPDFKIIQFSKAPREGWVKTRMSPQLSSRQSVLLHCSLTEWTVRQAIQSQLCPFELWVESEPEHEFFQRLIRDYNLSLHQQCAGNLGKKMSDAIAAGLLACKGIIVIGSDCPSINRNYLRKAIIKLAEGKEVVVGPARDGGYVLIGLSVNANDIFTDIAWGGDQVLEQTLAKINRAGLSYSLLPEQADIDRPEDLQRLANTKYPTALQDFSG